MIFSARFGTRAVSSAVETLSTSIIIILAGISLLTAGCAVSTVEPPLEEGVVGSDLPEVESNGQTVGPGGNPYKWVREGGVSPVPLYPPIRLQDTREVRLFLQAYTSNSRKFITDSLDRRELYIDMIHRVLSAKGLPMELANLALIESCFRADARSSQGAVGLWQLIKPTARSLGLTVNLFRDEREDPVRSTVAAAKYMAKLFDQLGDWLLVIAAYNSGPRKVTDAIARCGSRSFFDLARCENGGLRQETKDFVAKFIAVTLIMRNMDLYGFEHERRQYQPTGNTTGATR